MNKVLLIQNVISNYRVPVYNIIAKEFDLTVLYSSGTVPKDATFQSLYLGAKKKGAFTFFEKGIYSIIRDFDVVVFPYDPMHISLLVELVRSKIGGKTKFIPWGIGVPASYNVKYDSPTRSSKLFYMLAKWADAAVFYSDYPKDKYKKMGVLDEKLFVAHNTVAVYDLDNYNESERDSILFVGSLYKQKGVGLLLEAYLRAYNSSSNLLPLFIIGGGEEYENIKKWICDNKLEHKIHLEGAIYDEVQLASYFLRARACISPNQAGLSVQKSLGYGVPFVTKEDAITGGEIFDVHNGNTGVLYKEDSQLADMIMDINNNPNKYLEMGALGKKFYNENRTVDMMAQSTINAIYYVLK